MLVEAALDTEVNYSCHTGSVLSDVVLELCHIVGSKESRTDAALRYRIRPLQITEHDKHALQLDHDLNFVPTPRIHSGSAFSFLVPTTSRML